MQVMAKQTLNQTKAQFGLRKLYLKPVFETQYSG